MVIESVFTLPFHKISEKLFKNAIQEGSKISHEKIREVELAAQRKVEAERKAAEELEENARIEKKAKDFKFAVGCAIKMFSQLRKHSFSFERFVEYCTRQGFDQTYELSQLTKN